MTDHHWIVWIVAMVIAVEIARHVGAWLMIVAVVVLVGWTISVEKRPFKA